MTTAPQEEAGPVFVVCPHWAMARPIGLLMAIAVLALTATAGCTEETRPAPAAPRPRMPP
jgi:hypothetical protein